MIKIKTLEAQTNKQRIEMTEKKIPLGKQNSREGRPEGYKNP